MSPGVKWRIYEWSHHNFGGNVFLPHLPGYPLAAWTLLTHLVQSYTKVSLSCIYWFDVPWKLFGHWAKNYLCSINVSHHTAFLMACLYWKSVNILGQPLNNKCADISEFEGKQIAVEICKFAKSNLVQVDIKLTYFAGVALNSIGVLDMARISWAQEYLEEKSHEQRWR